MLVVTDISLIGWLFSALDGTSGLMSVLAIAGIASLSIGIMAIHRLIERRIEQIGNL